MGYELDFLGIGDGTRSGDAIALRYGNLYGGRNDQTVVIIDGGTQESGAELVKHVRRYYGTDRADFVFSSHPDTDHASGLTVVLEELKVGALLMHKPWEHAHEIRALFANDRIAVRGLEAKIERALQDTKDLEVIAKRKGVPIYEPFAGLQFPDGALVILGPSQSYYQSLICDFRRTPESKFGGSSMLTRAYGALQELAVRVVEALHIETLDDSGVTSAENNSSVVLLLRVEGESVLFTSDAGIPALTQAANYAGTLGIDLGALTVLQVPHHGSRRNVGPTILNRIRAPLACISVCKGGAPKHPSQRVINALVRRHSQVYATKGVNLSYGRNAPNRAWSPATALPFVSEFDE